MGMGHEGEGKGPKIQHGCFEGLVGGSSDDDQRSRKPKFILRISTFLMYSLCF